MSCAAFTLLGLYSAATNQNNKSVAVLTAALAVVFLLVAAYGAWVDEHREVDKAIALLDDEKSRQQCPNFEISLGQLLYLYLAESNCTVVLVACTITNHGAPSPTMYWQGNLRLQSSNQTVGYSNIPDPIFRWPIDDKNALILKKEKMLPAITSEVIETGHSKNGRILFEFSGDIRNEITWGAATLHIGCTDRKQKITWQELGRTYPTGNIFSLPDEEIASIPYPEPVEPSAPQLPDEAVWKLLKEWTSQEDPAQS